MITSPMMLVAAAEKAGITIPPNPREWAKNRDAYPHWYVFCLLQLNRMIVPGEHWENAVVLASITAKDLLKMDFNQLIKRGFRYPML